MRLMKCFDRVLGAIGAAMTVVKFLAVVLAALAGFVVVAAGMVAYLKREQWTKPAYRWVRDQSGRWGATPWTSAGPAAGGPEPVVEPVVEPIPADQDAS
jgi:hypothetical protein